jgi:hypothetical protein
VTACLAFTPIKAKQAGVDCLAFTPIKAKQAEKRVLNDINALGLACLACLPIYSKTSQTIHALARPDVTALACYLQSKVWSLTSAASDRVTARPNKRASGRATW